MISSSSGARKELMDIYEKLYRYYGPQGWWPARTPLEVIVGAILTQNTAWKNVEKAIGNLKNANILSSPSKIKNADKKTLAKLIKPAGYYNLKSDRLKNFIDFLFSEYGGSLPRISRRRTGALRSELLGVNGVGPETCDSILLYAFGRPVFVIDAYTRKVFSRHKFLEDHATYDEARRFFMDRLPRDRRLYNEYHALIVRVGKEFCKKNPNCSFCPLKDGKTKHH